jgi:hypothetical protein
VSRRRARFVVEEAGPPAAALGVVDGVAVRVASNAAGRLTVSARARWAIVRDARLVGDDALEVSGELRTAGASAVELVRSADGHTLAFPVELAGERFAARVDLGALRAVAPAHLEPAYRPGEEVEWELWLLAGAERIRLALPAPGAQCDHGDRFAALVASAVGDATLVERILSSPVSR